MLRGSMAIVKRGTETPPAPPSTPEPPESDGAPAGLPQPQPIDRAERNFPYPRAISTPLSQGARSFTPERPETEERGQRSDLTYVNTNNKSVLEKIPSLLTMVPVRKKGQQMGQYITSLKEAGISEEDLDGDHMGMYLRLTGSITASRNQKISELATTFCLPGQDPDQGKIDRLVEQTWNKELPIREAMDIIVGEGMSNFNQEKFLMKAPGCKSLAAGWKVWSKARKQEKQQSP